MSVKPCDYCGTPTPGHVEHVEPRQHGGSNLAVNTAHACTYCNWEKADRTPDEWAGDRVRVGLSWPPINHQAFIDGLVTACRALPDEDQERIVAQIHAVPDPGMGPVLLDLYKAARRSTAFTFASAAIDLQAASRRLPAVVA